MKLGTILGWAAILACWVGPGAAAEDTKPLEIELPEPYFSGTPLEYSSPNYEQDVVMFRKPFPAPAGTVNVSKGKPVTCSDPTPLFGKPAMLTDGVKSHEKEVVTELHAGAQWVQIDLESEFEIYAILVWHYYVNERVYFDVSAKVSDDPTFAKSTVVYNNDHDNSAGFGVGADKEYKETYEGRLMDAKGVKGRYVRLYSNGNTTDDMNHYIEVEVFAKPAK